MRPSTRLRLLTGADLPSAVQLSAMNGWNQTAADWGRLLALSPSGCFVAEDDGRVVATVTTTVYPPQLAWIGMMLVHEEHRREGIGRALMKRCLGHLRGQQIGCVKLDATPVGKQLYDQLGFRAECNLTRWQLPGRQPNASLPRGAEVSRKMLALANAMDNSAFGVSRGLLLRDLGEQSRFAASVGADSQVEGYAMIRGGARALYLGPVVAENSAAALRLVGQLVAGVQGVSIYWDIPDSQGSACAWAGEHGFIPQRPLIRMWRGETHVIGEPGKIFGIAGPEVG